MGIGKYNNLQEKKAERWLITNEKLKRLNNRFELAKESTNWKIRPLRLPNLRNRKKKKMKKNK